MDAATFVGKSFNGCSNICWGEKFSVYIKFECLWVFILL